MAMLLLFPLVSALPSPTSTDTLRPNGGKEGRGRLLVRHLSGDAQPQAHGGWMTAEEVLGGTNWTQAMRVIRSRMAEDMALYFNGEGDGTTELRDYERVRMHALGARDAGLDETLLTVLEVLMPDQDTWAPFTDESNPVRELNSLVEAHRDRAYLVIRNFPSDDALEQGWDAIQNCPGRISSEVLIASHGRNPACWAGQSGLSSSQRAAWDGPHERVGRSLADYAQLVRMSGMQKTRGGHAPNSSFAESEAMHFSLFDYSIPRQCPHVQKLLEVPHYYQAFGTQGYIVGPGFPRMYVHPEGAMSGTHRDGMHSYFWLRLMRGRKTARVWAMDTSVADLHFGVSWDEMVGRYREFDLKEGDIFVGPSDGFHAVLTREPSLAVSINHFPLTSPPPAPPAPPSAFDSHDDQKVELGLSGQGFETWTPKNERDDTADSLRKEFVLQRLHALVLPGSEFVGCTAK